MRNSPSTLLAVHYVLSLKVFFNVTLIFSINKKMICFFKGGEMLCISFLTLSSGPICIFFIHFFSHFIYLFKKSYNKYVIAVLTYFLINSTEGTSSREYRRSLHLVRPALSLLYCNHWSGRCSVRTYWISKELSMRLVVVIASITSVSFQLCSYECFRNLSQKERINFESSLS